MTVSQGPLCLVGVTLNCFTPGIPEGQANHWCKRSFKSRYWRDGIHFSVLLCNFIYHFGVGITVVQVIQLFLPHLFSCRPRLARKREQDQTRQPFIYDILYNSWLCSRMASTKNLHVSVSIRVTGTKKNKKKKKKKRKKIYTIFAVHQTYWFCSNHGNGILYIKVKHVDQKRSVLSQNRHDSIYI